MKKSLRYGTCFMEVIVVTERERLIGLINKKQHYGDVIVENQMDDRYNRHIEIKNSELADYLLENGVIVPPVKIGDTVYTNCSMQGWYLRSKDRPYKAKVVYMGINGTKNYMNVVYEKGEYMLSFDFDKIGKTVFLTREEAKKALAERGYK